ncbi:hypothetical protein ABMA28_001386 [Loxostege sticticalis]|uniref:Reverse transcriptase domain-containing protein n=1 Tax=Loxostege sticticalis TaxID=481309 RepID=A0ABD0T1H9_LOXSC
MDDLTPDIMAINETWLGPGEEDRAPKLTDYRLRHTPRPSHIKKGLGGGVGFYVRRGINVRACPHPVTSASVEQMWISTRLLNQVIIIGTAYRPPWLDPEVFLNAITESVASFTWADGLVLTGDFNINLLNEGSSRCRELMQCIHSQNLKQLIDEPTHYTDHSATLIDVICTDLRPSRVVVKYSPDLGRHAMLLAEFKIKTERTSPRWVTYRPFKDIVLEQLERDLSVIDWGGLGLNCLDNVDQLVEAFTQCVIGLMDLHAPTRTRKFKHPPHPWITDTIREMIRVRDDYHKKYQLQKTAALKHSYKAMKSLVSKAIEREKTLFFTKQINNNVNSPKMLWKNLKSTILPNKKNNVDLPSSLNDPDLINTHFLNVPGENKVTISQLTFYEHHRHEKSGSFSLHTVNEDLVLKTIRDLRSNAQGDDGLSLDMLLLTLPYSLGAITAIINRSILDGVFPENWKVAIVRPFPKTSQPSTVRELRPISILPCLSKILERIVCSQLTNYLEVQDILPHYQSGFRKGYGTATALAGVVDDLLAAQDRGMLTILTLLDFSRAFDSINTSLLLSKLRYYGLDSMSVKWFHSYLTQRRQRVELKRMDGSPLRSQTQMVTRGVPQGSILGPILYILYSADITNTITHCHHHMYADDLQVYLPFAPADCDRAVARVNEDLESISTWCNSNCLTINPNKSQFMVIGSPKNIAKLKDINTAILINGQPITRVDTAKNLGLVIDSNLKWRHAENCI